MNQLLLIDSHVHLHNCFDLNSYFISVFNNFSHSAKRINVEQEWTGVLLLTEVQDTNYFSLLKKSIETKSSILDSNKFKLTIGSDEQSIFITNKKNEKIIIFPGKQIIAENNIEVLALCTNKEFDTHQSLPSTIETINEENGIPVLPWGVGKWTGKRKEILNKFLTDNKNLKFYLGDNSGRPTFWSEPNLFRIGNSTNHFVLPGTDALAIPTEITKTASYGFYISNTLDEDKPSNSIKDIISNLTEPPKYFGRLEKIVPFFKNQMIMQLNKRNK